MMFIKPKELREWLERAGERDVEVRPLLETSDGKSYEFRLSWYDIVDGKMMDSDHFLLTIPKLTSSSQSLKESP